MADTLSLKESPALQRKLILPVCACDLVLSVMLQDFFLSLSLGEGFEP